MSIFISFEGIDGCGKTTQLEKLRDFLHVYGKTVVATREPGGTALAEKIREFLLHGASTISPRTELLLFAAARAQHVEEVIAPALKQGHWVLSDRFMDSMTAYQGGGSRVIRSKIDQLNNFATGDVKPDLTFVFDIDVSIALSRRSSRLDEDRIEKRGAQFQHRVREAYRQIAKEEPERVVLIDASVSVDEIHHEVVGTLSARNLIR